MEYSLDSYFINQFVAGRFDQLGRIVPFLIRGQPITNCSHKLLQLQDEISTPKDDSEKIVKHPQTPKTHKLIPSSAKCLNFDCILPIPNKN